MKKLLTVIAWTLALNFLAAAGGVAYLFRTQKLDHDKIAQIKTLVFPPASQPAPAIDDTRDPTTQPTLKLEQMLAQVSGRAASEQVEFMQRTFDSQAALLDRRFQELQNLRKTLDEAKAQAAKDRDKLTADQKKLADAQQQQAKLQTDKNFQDTLALYTTMPAKQVKAIFMTMSDDTIIQYLRAMEPRQATKITKEFKAPEETARIAKVMETMRQSQASTTP
jgi:flagellar motility protein MotE (MotC chaperone)